MTTRYGKDEIQQIPSVTRGEDSPEVAVQERKAAIEMARQCIRDGWNRADLADVLGALGMLTQDQAERVAEKLQLELDPGYVAMCPGNKHPAKGNIYRASDSRWRCRPCGQEQGVRKRQETKEARGAW